MRTGSSSANSPSDPLSSHVCSSWASRLVATALPMAVGLLLIASPATGQDPLGEPASDGSEPTISGQASLRAVVGVPRGGLRDNISTGGGLQGFIGAWTGPGSPLLIGLDVAALSYGKSVEEVPFSSTVGPRVPVEVETSNNVLETHLSARLQRRTGRFRPYIEGLAGFKYLFTRTTVGDEGIGDDFGDEEILGDETASSINYDDFALSGGVGAGVDIQVYRPNNPKKSVRRVSLHLGVQYLLGQEAEYLADGTLTDENNNGRLEESEMDVRRSRTTFLQPQFGVTFRLADTD